MKKRTILYLVFSFLFAWGIWVGVSLLGWDISNPMVSLVVSAGSWAPALAVLLVKLMDGQNGPVLLASMKPNLKGNIRWYLCAWFLPVLLVLLGSTLYFMLFPATLDFSMSYLRATYEMTLGDAFPITPTLLLTGLISGLASAVLIAPLIGMVTTLGGEIGWRGYLFPALRAQHGPVAAHLLTGLIWGLWFAPQIVLMGANYGTGYTGAPWLGVLAMCVFTFSSGVILSWLCGKTGSVWTAALGMGAINTAASLPLFFQNVNEPMNLLLGPYSTGLIAGLPALALAIVLMLSEHKRAKSEPAAAPNTVQYPQ